MYKLLLAWRYLRTRYIALASIVSVTLGVATLIIVNSVMAGFTREMHIRLQSILSDIVVESHGLDGFPDPAWHMAEIQKVLGDDIKGITATVHVPAMLSYQVRGQWLTRQVTLIGIDRCNLCQRGRLPPVFAPSCEPRSLRVQPPREGYGDDAQRFRPPAGSTAAPKPNWNGRTASKCNRPKQAATSGERWPDS